MTVTKLLKESDTCKLSRHELPSQREIETCGVKQSSLISLHLLKTNVERHPEGFGDALQLHNGDVLLARRQGVKVGTLDAKPFGQFLLSHVFFNMAFFKSIFVSFFIVFVFKLFILIASPPSLAVRLRLFTGLIKNSRDLSLWVDDFLVVSTKSGSENRPLTHLLLFALYNEGEGS